MIRISNRNHSQSSGGISAGPQIQYVDRIVEVPVHIHSQSEPEIQVVEREVPVVSERVVEKVVHIEAPQVDLAPIHERSNRHEKALIQLHELYQNMAHSISGELEMQRRALVGLKTQRDIDRSRRLMLIRRMKKEQNLAKKREFKLKLAIGAGLLLSIVSLIVKL